MNTLKHLALSTTLFGAAHAQSLNDRVTFESHGTQLVGQLYLPENLQARADTPVIIVTGSWTSVKEQMPANYAEALTAQGYAALTFDFRGWGESGGDFRFVEDPHAKTQDIIAAAAFLRSDPRFSDNPIISLGICASAGYAIDAAHQASDITAAITVAPWLHDAEIVDAVYGGADNVAAMREMGRQARDTFESSGDLTLVPAASLEDDSAIMYQAPYYTEPERGLIPEYDNQFNLATWEPWLSYDAIQTARMIEKPVLLIHSESAAIPQGAKKFSEQIGANGQITWLEDISQFDFYDDPKAIQQAVDRAVEFIEETIEVESEKASEEAAIRTIIQAVGTLADLGEFEALERLYASEIMVDYSSLTGAEPELKSAQSLMTEWASILPGFDQTHHQISDIKIDFLNKAAHVTADVLADHWVNGLHWQVSGKYEYTLEKDDAWRIAQHRFILASETGTREVFAAAAQNVQDTSSNYILRQQSEIAVRSFLESLETKDMERFASIWSEDAIQDMPFSPEGFPKRVAGKDALIAHYAQWPEISGAADFTSELVFYPSQDPQIIFAEWSGDVDIVPTGRKYLQTYGGLFHVENGKITLFREYYDPIVFAEAFGI